MTTEKLLLIMAALEAVACVALLFLLDSPAIGLLFIVCASGFVTTTLYRRKK